MTARRGMTLIELLISVAITAIAIAASTAIFVQTGSFIRDTNEVADSNVGSRLGGDAIAGKVRIAGMGAAQGVYVGVAGVSLAVNAVFGTDNLGLNNSDDLWVVVPDRDVLLDNFSTPGAYTSVVSATASSPVTVLVNGTTGFTAGDILMVTNLNSAALLTRTTLNVPGPNQISYAETAVPNFSDSPTGYHPGDMVFRARILRFYLALEPTGRSALYMAFGKMGPSAAQPFIIDPAIAPLLVQKYVEDLQVVYWTDPQLTNDPTKYVNQHGLAPAFTPGLRAVSVNVVAMTRELLLDSRSNALASPTTSPITIANHIGAGPAGYRRSLFSRRIEIANLSLNNL